MIIKLPRTCSGEEILEAFKASVPFKTPKVRWKIAEHSQEMQYEPGSVRRVIRSMGLCMLHYSFNKRWVFWGERVWDLDSGPIFKLDPLVLSEYYKEVQIGIEYDYSDCDARRIIKKEPNEFGFEENRSQFERMLEIFFGHLALKPQSV